MSWEDTQKTLDDALNVVMSLGFTQQQGETLIKAIAKGEVPNISIKY